MVTGTTFHQEGAMVPWREVVSFFDLYSNPWFFTVTQPIMGIATLFSGNCGISNPISFCNPESLESPETPGVAGRCDPEVGNIATPPPFSCLLFDLAQTRPKIGYSVSCPSQAHKAPTRPAPVWGECFPDPAMQVPTLIPRN